MLPVFGALLLLAPLPARGDGADYRGAQLLTLATANFTAAEPGENSGAQVLVSPRMSAAISWSELVVSWNVDPNVVLTVEVRALRPEGATHYYALGRWAADPTLGPRASIPGQKDEEGEVRTDTLVLTRPAVDFQLRLTLRGDAGGGKGVELLTVSVLDPSISPAPLPANQKAWGRTLQVPVRSQADYPEGVQNWCSPTSMAMILGYWAKRWRRPALDWDVPQVARLVHDPEWPGTGNWPFNTAFAGMQPGLRACVARFTDVSEIEDWIARGFPVAASVSYAQLLGKPKTALGDGHLVVVVGFTKSGEVVVNDPGVRRERVRRVIPRDHFIAAWARSHRTVYLVWPERALLPPNPRGHW
jgi:uncharacterized protein YvpB